MNIVCVISTEYEIKLNSLFNVSLIILLFSDSAYLPQRKDGVDMMTEQATKFLIADVTVKMLLKVHNPCSIDGTASA